MRNDRKKRLNHRSKKGRTSAHKPPLFIIWTKEVYDERGREVWTF